MFKSFTPLTCCLIVSTIANVTTAGMVAWFLIVKPSVHASGGVGIYGGVRVDGGNIDVNADKDAIQKVMLCEETYETSKVPIAPIVGQPSSQQARVAHCASLDRSGPALAGFQSYGLSVVPAPNR
jgi:hypothetical protein